jgi:hypothetical protein
MRRLSLLIILSAILPALTVMPFPLAAKSADRLPLTHGIFVATDTACKGAPNVAIMSYWGGNNGLNISKESCTIKRMTRNGSAYTLTRSCSDLQQHEAEDTVKLVITNPKAFSLDGISYRWCGKKVEF